MAYLQELTTRLCKIITPDIEPEQLDIGAFCYFQNVP
jgi:hypothetical protein